MTHRPLYLEAHITLCPRDLAEQREMRTKLSYLERTHGWHSSVISDDEVMGKGPRLYYTKSESHFDILRKHLDNAAARIAMDGYDIKRKKIEVAIYDEVF